ncbi:unnamed protein product [Lactuca saligna]|uniref:TIR domain-containing protein n=1 Tax=Lactuca saligna TaxID=75948 RepID=A0AA36EIN6_LACSI|nr:unnamed protein product [Lactuca saligna]
MASSSTSPIHSFQYDVFLSFRGEDTRKNFVDHLYLALEQRKISTYKDDEKIEKGKRISEQLIRSIEDSKFYIIVFSKNYASSSWCLDELVKIMECHKTNERIAYPIFYDVEPTEVRHQTGAVGKAFAKHEKEESAEKWRDALKEAATLAGWELKNTVDGHEAKFIEKIIEDLLLKLPSNDLIIDDNLVGMETRINEVLSFLGVGFDDVRMVGIKGMGGCGKTTLARAVFNQIYSKFEGCSFLENVRENSCSVSLKSLQEQVLLNVVLNAHPITINIQGDKKRLMKQMSRTKVLVVLDDVDCVEQLEALAGKPNWFGKGSRIIITTRDEQVLLKHNVKLIYNVKLLSDEEAVCLFSRHAYGRDIPISEEHKGMLRKVLHYAEGLPLVIRVLGLNLGANDSANERGWKETLEELKTIPLEETSKKLELSYSGLEKDYKEMFLDVVCLLKGETKDYATEALKSCEDYAKLDLKVLERKSLITFYKNSMGYECVGMHDHIEEMGWNIVRRLHPDKPNQHSRLWIDEEIEYILANDLGTDATRCIQLRTKKLNPEIVMQGLRKMKQLRFLDVHVEKNIRANIFDRFPWNWKFNKFAPYFPNALQYLRWNNYPFRSLPRTFQADNLVSLEIAHGEIVQLWEGEERKVLNKLKFLDLYNSRLRTLDLRLTPNLEKLSLGGSNDLVELDMGAGCLKLIYIDISFSKLRCLDLRPAVNLELLVLKNCDELVELHMPSICLKLRSFHLSNSKLGRIDLRHASNLEVLRIDRCVNLRSLTLLKSKLRTLEIGLTPNLERLDLQKSDNLEKLHMADICEKLAYIDISHSKLRTFDIGLTPNLEHLDLQNCDNLEELPMVNSYEKLAYLDISHSKLRSADLRLTPNLKTLKLTNCSHLVELKAPAGYVKGLVYLSLTGCLRFSSFTYRSVDESDQVGPLAELHLIAKPQEICPIHPHNKLPKFQFACFYEKSPPSLSSNLEELISFGLCACTNFTRISRSICGLRNLRKLKLQGSFPEAPKDLHQLDCLEELSLLSTNIKHLPDSICMLKHLKSLELNKCSLLEKLPEDLGQLECLEKLYLIECKFLQDIPNSICNMKCLQVLHIKGTSISHLPRSILLLKGLSIRGSRQLLESFGFTSEIQTSKNQTLCHVESSKSQFTKNYCKRRTRDKTTTTWKIPKMSFIHALYHIRIQASDVKILIYVDFVHVN